MKLLNVGAGPIRPPHPFVNLDNLRTQLPPGTGARIQLDSEPNYVEHDLSAVKMPFDDETFDAVVCAHVIEHFPAQKGMTLMEDCRRLLKPGGWLIVSVPDASYFRLVYHQDRKDNWPSLFDTTDPNNGYDTFHRAALWYDVHEVILTEDALWSYFVRAGFNPESIARVKSRHGLLPCLDEPLIAGLDILDRWKFSLVEVCRK